ncbi:MAG: DUF4124 domain-containing protein [Geobacteraceae bacterium]|nr:DUF4124 domain-containing protein [Geobacteraceae bacterium]
MPLIKIHNLKCRISGKLATVGRNRWLLFLPTLLSLLTTSHAASYKWTDRDGTLHFSDTPPSYEVPKDSLSFEDNEQRPLMGKGLVVYQDRVLKIVLADEQQDKLLFDVEYTDVQHVYPEAVRGTLRLMIVSSLDRGRTSTYLAYTVAPVDGGSRKFSMMNALSDHSPSRLETELLHISLSVDDREKKDYRILLKKDIPFRKVWEKRAGVKYQ